MNEKKEYIDRALLRESFNEVLPDFWGVMQGEEIFAVIDSIVPADVAPVVHGEWRDNHCTVCGMTPFGEELWEHLSIDPPRYEYCMYYCLICGAKMDGGRP